MGMTRLFERDERCAPIAGKIERNCEMNPDKLAEQYIALWNERDPELRRRHIAELWAPAGEQKTLNRVAICSGVA